MTTPADTAGQAESLVERLRDMKMGFAHEVAFELDDLCQEAAAHIAELEAECRDSNQLAYEDFQLRKKAEARVRELEAVIQRYVNWHFTNDRREPGYVIAKDARDLLQQGEG